MGAVATTTTMQGIQVPDTAVDPATFFRLTRRNNFQLRKNAGWTGLGGSEQVTQLKSGILSGFTVTVKGQIVVPAGTSWFKGRWPHDLIRTLRFSANGQSQLISCSGGKLKVLEVMSEKGLTDRGIPFTVNGTAHTNGSLLLADDSAGYAGAVPVTVGAAVAAGTYDFELSWTVPVAWDPRTLVGAIFAQTSGTDLNLQWDWATAADLNSNHGTFVLPTFQNVTFDVDAEVFSIPESGGIAVVPDLSLFHQVTQGRETGIATGTNEHRLAGQGIGRQLLRVVGQVWTDQRPTGAGSSSVLPLPVRAANFDSFAYTFGGNTSPEPRQARVMAKRAERAYSSRIGNPFGFWCYDFAERFTARDSIDMGSASELRVSYGIQPTVVAGNVVLDSFEYITETMFSSNVGA